MSDLSGSNRKALSLSSCRIGKNSLGFGLIEVMIAMGISSVVAVGMMAVMENAQKGQKGMAQSMDWNSVKAELQMLFNTGSSCIKVMNYNGFYTVGAPAPGTTVTDMPNNRQIIIPRSTGAAATYFQKDFIYTNSAGIQSFKFTDVSLQGAVPGGTPNVIEVDVQVKIDRTIGSVRALGAKEGALTIHLVLTRNATPGPNYNRLLSCSSDYNSLGPQQACESMGGIWRSPAPGSEPNCQIVQPKPSYVPAAGYPSQPYQNLCSPGQVLSGIDLSTGQAKAACTNSTPISSGIPTCSGGILTWEADAAIPSRGKYRCLALPGAVAGTNVPTGTVVNTPGGCASNQHLTWDAINSRFSCTNDTLPPAAPTNCPAGQFGIWNGSGYTCRPFLQPTVNCTGPRSYLQWDNTAKTYSCRNIPAPASTSCAAGQFLAWTGDTFVCGHIDGKAEYQGNGCASDGQYMYYDSGTGKFKCATVAQTPPTPGITCRGEGAALGYVRSPAGSGPGPGYYTCNSIWPIRYDDCFDSYGEEGIWPTCGNSHVAIGFCASAGGRDCFPGFGSKYYLNDDDKFEQRVRIRCCRVDGIRSSGAEIYRSVNLNGDMNIPNNSKNSYGNLALCRAGDVVVSVCGSGGGKQCGGMSAGVGCARISGFRVANAASSNIQYGNQVALPNLGRACRLVSNDGYGAWQVCGAGEVLSGVCSSGSNADCTWGNRGSDAYNQAFCCPLDTSPVSNP
jgi:Tfp pilus assembly protein PilV